MIVLEGELLPCGGRGKRRQVLHPVQPVLGIIIISPHSVSGHVPVEIIREILRGRRKQQIARGQARMQVDLEQGDFAPFAPALATLGPPTKGAKRNPPSGRVKSRRLLMGQF